MKDSLYDRLWRRECGELSSTAGLRGIYGSKEWINDLDIVNELGGHTGCVNALSWSRSGRLLASGSDDQHLNIYSYQPESSNAPFSLNTTVATGHRANIFSVKFMPHSNDRTLITCAGDSQVRVFDIEHSSANSNSNVDANATSAFAASARSRRFNNFFEGTRYLSEGNTNARVYRSHADRVKRIVTESSPYLFLTCSEDGEVRQWDLRQPSSAYPSPRGGQGFMAYRPGLEHDDSNVPPPLISYKKFRLDLNTISCSPTQPHYIALGGAHMHCFLHDRRMPGRDTSAERGTPDVATPSVGSVDDELMGKATRCVRRFAPRGKRRVRRLDDGHITACKISDANPDEMVVSWSGDHIYSFDLIRSLDARDSSFEDNSKLTSTGTSRKNGSRSGKRKRPKPSSMSSQESANRHHSRRRSADPDTLRVQYENGESSDIPFPEISEGAETPEGMLERARYSVLNDAQRLSMDIAKGLVKLRQALFSLKATAREATESDEPDLTPYSENFNTALDLATTYLPHMERVMREWAYPMNPSQGTVGLERSLRENRQASWRFVQAAGTLARVLLHTTDDSETPVAFSQIIPAPNEDGTIDREAQFGYDFLKAILLWLQGGRQELLRGFKRGVCSPRVNGRFPLDADADEDAIDTAVVAFGNAVKLPLENLGNTAARIDRRRVSNPSSQVRSLDRASATRFWILRVGRGVLMQAANGVNYSFVNRAFGGLHTSAVEDSSDIEVERSQDDAEANEEEQAIRTINLVRSGGSARAAAMEMATSSDDNDGESSDDEDLERLPVTHESDSDDEDEDEGSDSDGESDDQDGDGWHMDLVGSDEEESESDEPLFLRGASRKSRRGNVELDVPCSAHTRMYWGHCNIKTVKDVNFFGLNDEYVVSGSDSGHVFIWNRETAELVNILEGDSEVVNVVQGHPYEPTLAVSGIDNTIKIFSPDRHAQEQARRGHNILDPDNPANSLGATVHNLGGLQSRKRLSDSYRIMSQNDVDRRGGMSEAYITRSMLARLAATLRGRQGGAGGAGGLGAIPGEGASVVLDDNCVVM
ncbi:uncharacterized protein N7477_004136 [Penicillium maclennaniae]|uniref:uncharacterized protein n=1 Tax=Penicillium maclennaniae TaxID=1343394 RepID=UPI00253FAFBD|nr:uncharacterized protein N7477_004136 [Penicillium maclennaniae]KAJ5678503.1 hypothetical protein N7477_004136 [Penicillium maclennaniae]